MIHRPDFDQLLAVLRREKPDRPVLFEFFIHEHLLARVTGMDQELEWSTPNYCRRIVRGFAALGYDYAPLQASRFAFSSAEKHVEASYSLDETAVIHDQASFEAYPWPDPEDDRTPNLDALEPELPHGMKVVVWGPGGVLENVISLLGFTQLIYLLEDDPQFVQAVFDAVGSRLEAYYAMAAAHPAVGAAFPSDDWGFATGTMLTPDQLRRFVFPWHRRIVQAIHANGKPAILHSCGQLERVMPDVIADLGYQAKHSYEDKITPVESAYDRWGDRIAILGGIDVDFLCRRPAVEITARARALLEQTQCRGYALGSGNSIPHYVPDEGYFAMIAAAKG